MSNFDYDKIKDMEYDPKRDRYIGKDGSELSVTPYANGKGYKYDYYKSSTYDNAKHNSTHVKSDLNENWKRTDNDRDNNTQTKSSGSGCYLTTACLKHFQESFDDNCYELSVLRWFRDKFVTKEDIEHYYKVAPVIVSALESNPSNNDTYNYIYEHVIKACVDAIHNKNYDFAYDRYKTNVLELEKQYVINI